MPKKFPFNPNILIYKQFALNKYTGLPVFTEAMKLARIRFSARYDDLGFLEGYKIRTPNKKQTFRLIRKLNQVNPQLNFFY